MAHDEVLTEISLPPPPPYTGSLYIKHSPRGAMDIATVGVASVVTVDRRSGVCADARIALGAVAPTPLRAYAAEDMLRGRELSAELLQAAADEAMAQSSPIDDIRGTAGYRRQMSGVLTRRTLGAGNRIGHRQSARLRRPSAVGDSGSLLSDWRLRTQGRLPPSTVSI